MAERPLLIPLTAEAKSALIGRDAVEIECLPFRIGRESRLALVEGELQYMERRKGSEKPNNDLYLFDVGKRLNISREHLQIDTARNGEFLVYDRGSACGTHVAGVYIGGKGRTGKAILENDSEIIIGAHDSPYRFTVKHLERLKESAIGNGSTA